MEDPLDRFNSVLRHSSCDEFERETPFPGNGEIRRLPSHNGRIKSISETREDASREDVTYFHP